MIGTLFRFLLLRVLGGRAAAVLAVIGVILGWRNRRAADRLDRSGGTRYGAGAYGAEGRRADDYRAGTSATGGTSRPPGGSS